MPRRLVLALLAATVALAGCGGDDDASTRDEGAYAARTAPTATRPADGELVEGTGYSLRAPDGWDDHSDNAAAFQAAGVRPDIVVADKPEDGFAANINVLRQDGLPDGLDVVRFADESRRALREASGELARSLEPTDVGELREVELDGEEARAFDYSGESRGLELRFRQVFTIRDGAGYIVTYTDRRDAFAKGAAALDAVLASWKWE